MRILVISFHFPPSNVIGAVRVGKTAQYLARFGHDVRVVSAAQPLSRRPLKVDFPEDRVVYARWQDLDAPWNAVLSLGNRVRARLHGIRTRARGEEGSPSAPGSGAPVVAESFAERRTLFWHLRTAYKDLLHIPDFAMGWLGPATRAAAEVCRDWRPDVVLASGLPVTAFLVARRVAAMTGAPWVADLRDMWFGNPYSQFSPWRQRLVDSRLERRVLGTAGGMVTVSGPLAEELRRRYPGTPADVVLNGYDAEDIERAAPTAPRPARGDEPLQLVYTGNLYPGRDLRPLIEALHLLGEEARSVRVEIIGNSDDAVRQHYQPLADARGVGHCFHWLPAVPHLESVRVQRSADALLLVMNTDPSEAGIYTGKIFEYIGARRPILLVGLATGVAAALVRERELGAVTTTAEEVAAALREWIRQKRARGSLPDTSAAAEDLSREAQTRVLERMLRQVAGSRVDDPAPAAVETAAAAAS